MRTLLRKIILWLIHEHDGEILYRIITIKQHPIEHSWADDKIQALWWRCKCKTCGRKYNKRII